jgi:hypothetical protein
MDKYDLPSILFISLKEMGGQAKIVDVSKHIWEKYKKELQDSGDIFYTWQYDVRWAATELRKTGKMKSDKISPKGLWELV